ncbi:Lrp/AsnC family transcriptional regulator [Haloarchaeobius sp. HME9146]|uniref:Lrp/AsnC family transcriptional regulator n=1 Tax=Haloarchaeobius sp. HME9146 TaxID=2978732 RepID=UPI0021BFE56A|nr:Lrp/AsnC family transcriptional regulator [Haloarchaeobius sp. HME9146]MCT9097938.1 Lrp/AsnC family transcriptional regulator [Haloarchaeobius sp. HME9146]
MTLDGLDELDRRILRNLQRDARHVSSRNIAESISASPSTVRKRIQRLEEQGIIDGYHADVNYDNAGYQLHVQITCTAPIPERETMSDEAMSVPGVIGVRELATGERNVLVTVVGEDGDDLTRIATDLSDIGLTILDEELVRSERNRPFSGFGDIDEDLG